MATVRRRRREGDGQWAAISEEACLTVAEAAAILRVSQATVRRWVRRGDLPAYRVGTRWLRIQRGDLAKVVVPVGGGPRLSETPTLAEFIKGARRPLNEDDRQRGLAALDRAERHADDMLAGGGRLFPPSWQLINEARDERSRQLDEAMDRQPDDQRS